MPKVRIVLESICDYRGPTEVWLSDAAFNELCRKYGTPNFSWYPVSTTTIKAFDGENEKWLYIKLSALEGVTRERGQSYG